MEQFKKFYHGEKNNNQSDLNVLNATAHTFPEEYAKIFWRAALEWFYDELDYSIEHKELKDIIENELGGGD